MDGDARGGAALSIKAVTGKPIKFFGVGEKLEALEMFYPDRIASRIIGMGDVLTFIEKAQVAFEEKKAEEMAKKGEEMIKKRGIKTTSETRGNTTCTTMAPPARPRKSVRYSISTARAAVSIRVG